jgi:uncharacterized protein (PEP-CTERM system associated)
MAITIAKMLRIGCRKPCHPLASMVALAALTWASGGQAAEWRIVPQLNLREIYSDNVRLAQSGLETSDFITEISPGISIASNGPGLKLKANYTFQHFRYADDSKGSTSHHRLDAGATLELVKDLFAVDGTAAISQQDVALLGTTSVNDYAITGNRTTVKSLNISPYVHHNFRGIALGELRYAYSRVDTDSAVLSNSRLDSVRLNLASDPSFRTLGWGLRYDAQRTEQSNANAVDSATSSADLRFMLTPQFYLTATAGYDDYDYVAAANAEEPKGAFYMGGFSWRPTQRTSLSASAGRRFFGKTFSLSSSVRSRSSFWRLSYDESITTASAQFSLTATESTSDFLNQLFRSSIPDDTLRQHAVDRFILNAGLPSSLSRSVNYLTNQFFLQKSLRASVAMTGAKNTVLLTVFSTLRQPQTALDTAMLFTSPASLANAGDTRQSGVTAIWNWKISVLTSANFSADMVRKKTNSFGTEDRLRMYKASFTRQLQPKLSGIVELRHAEQTSDIAANNYHENALMAFLSMKF